MDAEVSNSGRLLELFGCDCNLDAALRQVVDLEILSGIESRVRAQRCEQKFRRRHASVIAAVLGWLIAKKSVRTGLNDELYMVNVFDGDFHKNLAFSEKKATLAAKRYSTADFFPALGNPSIRRYSWVRTQAPILESDKRSQSRCILQRTEGRIPSHQGNDLTSLSKQNSVLPWWFCWSAL
jgi:hypothetical protein